MYVNEGLGMYNADLKEKTIPLESLYLDPNNPRFPDKKSHVKSDRIKEVDVQAKANQRMAGYGVRELANSIIRNGFLPLDRIVVMEIEGQPGSYVVVEGNRRLAALRLVDREIAADEVEADDLSESYLTDLRASIQAIDCLVYTGSNTDIAWILQGVRHLSGIKDWSPAQKAELVVKEIDQSKLKFRAVGEMLGMTANQVGKYYRSYKALEQMRNDADFGDRYDKSYFTLFDEAYSKTNLRSWLGWNENANRFENTAELHEFYQWITPDPENDNRRRIHDPRQMKILSKLVDPKHAAVLADFNDGNIESIEQAEARIASEPPVVDWHSKIAQVQDALKGVPLVAIEKPEELSEKLKNIESTIKKLIIAVDAVVQESATA